MQIPGSPGGMPQMGETQAVNKCQKATCPMAQKKDKSPKSKLAAIPNSITALYPPDTVPSIKKQKRVQTLRVHQVRIRVRTERRHHVGIVVRTTCSWSSATSTSTLPGYKHSAQCTRDGAWMRQIYRH